MPFKVFIGYSDLPAVRRATAVIADAIRRSGRHFELHPLLWRFDQLASAHWRDRAVAAAREADIVVLASSAAGALNPPIEEWLNAFLNANRGHRATIVSVSGASEAWTITIEHNALAARPENPTAVGRQLVVA